MSRCPFLIKKNGERLFCLSPDNPSGKPGLEIDYKQIDTYRIDTNKCTINGGSSCEYNFDHNNKQKYGGGAPLFCERIWVNPLDCKMAMIFEPPVFNYMLSGQVIEDQWPPKQVRQVIPVLELQKVQHCIDRWCNHLEWHLTGAYDFLKESIDKFGQYDRCSTFKEVEERYRKLDLIFAQVKKEGRLRPSQEIDPAIFRERRGIFVHIGPGNELYVGGGGIHRFAIAYILSLPVMPAKIGYVHRSAIPFLDKLRNEGAQ